MPLPREGELFGKRISAFVCLKYRFACQTEDWVGNADTESTRLAAAAGAQPLSEQPERVGGDRPRRGSSAQGLRVPQISAGHSHPRGDGAWKRGRGRTGKNRSHRHLPAPSRLWGAQPLGSRALHRFPETQGPPPPTHTPLPLTVSSRGGTGLVCLPPIHPSHPAPSISWQIAAHSSYLS